jgi:hypothetical protein
MIGWPVIFGIVVVVLGAGRAVLKRRPGAVRPPEQNASYEIGPSITGTDLGGYSDPGHCDHGGGHGGDPGGGHH